jgi:hypothetical protein
LSSRNSATIRPLLQGALLDFGPIVERRPRDAESNASQWRECSLAEIVNLFASAF